MNLKKLSLSAKIVCCLNFFLSPYLAQFPIYFSFKYIFYNTFWTWSKKLWSRRKKKEIKWVREISHIPSKISEKLTNCYFIDAFCIILCCSHSRLTRRNQAWQGSRSMQRESKNVWLISGGYTTGHNLIWNVLKIAS